MPVDHLLLEESEALPAIVVLRLPTGLTHFVVVWRAHGPLVQVMDPARGRRWVRRASFLRDVYVHSLALPAEAFADWARSDGFTGPLLNRLRGLGIADGAALVDGALAASGWTALAALDQAVRTVAALVTAGAVAPGGEARRLVAALASGEAAGTPPARRFTRPRRRPRRPATAPSRSRFAGRCSCVCSARGPSPTSERSALPIELRAAVDEQPVRPAAELMRLLRGDGAWRWGALAVGVVLGRARHRGRGGAVSRPPRCRADAGPVRHGSPAAGGHLGDRAAGGARAAAGRGRGSRSGCGASSFARFRCCPTGTSRRAPSPTWRSAPIFCTACGSCRRWPETWRAWRIEIVVDCGGARLGRSAQRASRGGAGGRDAGASLRGRAGRRRARSAHAQPRRRAGAVLPGRSARDCGGANAPSGGGAGAGAPGSLGRVGAGGAFGARRCPDRRSRQRPLGVRAGQLAARRLSRRARVAPGSSRIPGPRCWSYFGRCRCRRSATSSRCWCSSCRLSET